MTLVSLGIMGDQLRVPHKTLNTIVIWCSEQFQGGGSRLDPHDTERRQILGRLDIFSYFSFGEIVI